MKFSLKTLAAAVVMAAAATGANAAIDNGNGGNGELFFNIWDASGSYTRSLETSIDSFQSQLGAVGNLGLNWAADATFTSFLAGVSDVNALKWNVVALDSSGARRLLTTYTAPEKAVTKGNDVIRSAVLEAQGFVGKANTALALAGADSVAVDSASTAFAGQVGFSSNIKGYLDFSNAGTLANNSFASGLGFMRIDAAATGIAKSVYNEYYDPSSNLLTDITKPVGGTAVNAWLDSNNVLHIAAVPEPSEYAMLLAGLGMIGFMARRNKRA